MKLCPRCKILKPLTDYHLNQSYCKPCKMLINKESRANNRLALQIQCREYYYKLSDGHFRAMLEKQNNRCAICGVSFTDKRKPYIDHNHLCCPTQKTCGKCVRGILCVTCNSVLGKFKDDVRLFQKAINYLSS